MKSRIGILTGGGDVQPLNAVIRAVVETANRNNIEVVGYAYGWQGLLENKFTILNDHIIDPLLGGTILKSSRVNLAKVEYGAERVIKNLAEQKVDGLIVIGGEDTLSNALYLKNIPQVLISKTIDNDVGIINTDSVVNYFTLGYPSAGEKISSFVSINEGLRTTAYSHERIIVVESMGMHAGWLALSSAMGHPDFIIIPEFPLDYKVFLEMVSEKYHRQKNIIIVLAEGARWADGSYISADHNEVDSFGHPRFKGAANLLADKMKKDLANKFDTRNVNSVNPSYLYRSGKPNELDLFAASELGREAIGLFKANLDKPVFLTMKYLNNKFVPESYPIIDVLNIEELHRFVTDRFYDHRLLTATDEGMKYLGKIIRELPKVCYGL